MLGDEIEIRRAAVLEVRISCVEISVHAKDSIAATLKFTMVNCIIVIIEIKNADAISAICEEAVAVKDFSRRKHLVDADSNSAASKITISLIDVLYLSFKCLLRGVVKSNRRSAAAVPTEANIPCIGIAVAPEHHPAIGAGPDDAGIAPVPDYG